MVNIIQAYINHDRWIAECPCKWAIIVPRTFTHFVCGVLPDGAISPSGCGYEAAVQYPSEADQIEAVLAVRERAGERNWNVNETLVDLRIQNAVLGVPSGLEGAI